MKPRTGSIRLLAWATVVLVGTAFAARGGLYAEGPWIGGFANGGAIPDGNASGWWDTRTVTDIPAGLTIDTVEVTFTISGGWNGDLSGYLSHDGVLIPLLNRVGQGTGAEPIFSFGYGDPGFNNVTLADGAAVNIHNYGGETVPTGAYAPDSGGLTFGVAFGGRNPNGDWTLFFADESEGGGQSRLVSWGLSLTAVPEPVNVAVAIFGLGAVGGGVGRRLCAGAKARS